MARRHVLPLRGDHVLNADAGVDGDFDAAFRGGKVAAGDLGAACEGLAGGDSVQLLECALAPA